MKDITMQKQNVANFMRTTALTAVSITAAMSITAPAYALDNLALPTNGSVVGGSAAIADNSYTHGEWIFRHTHPADTMNINQATDRVVIDWKSFNIGTNATVNFNQPAVTSLAVNRVKGNQNTASEIRGHLNANGNIMILDKNGVMFGDSSVVNVHGIIASTGDINPTEVMKGGNFSISGITNKRIELKGNITVTDGGLAAFVSPFVSNSGTITANLGKVTMAAGSKVTVDLYGDQLISIAASDTVADALLQNSGTINANGGKVTMTVNAAKSLVDEVINMKGIINANRVSQKDGKIILDGGNGKVVVGVTSKSDTSALLSNNSDLNANNGSVEITGNEVVLGYNTDINAKDITITTDALAMQNSNYEWFDWGWGWSLKIAEAADINATNFTLTRQDEGVISLGDGTTGLHLSNADLDVITADKLYIGNTDLTKNKTTDINLANVDLANNVNKAVMFSSTNTVNVAADKTVKLGNADVTANTLTLNLGSNVTTKGAVLGNASIVNVQNNKVNINHGIDFVKTSGTVNVAKGTYNQAVVVDKALTLNGANAGKSGTSSRGAETIITSTGADANISITASNVTVDGFSIVGDNKSSTADSAVSAFRTNNTIVKNNIISGAEYGVSFMASPSAATDGGLITQNLIQNIDDTAVNLGFNQYADVTNNTISKTAVGVSVIGMTEAAPAGKAHTVSGNTISASETGILSSIATGTSYRVASNTISAEGANLSSQWTGIKIATQGVDNSFDGNKIDGSAVNANRLAVGYEATAISSKGVSINGGSITGADYGIWATDGDNVGGSVGGVQDLKISNVDFKNITTGDILVEDTAGNSRTTHVSINSGNKFDNGVYDVILKGTAASSTTDNKAGVKSTLVKAAGNGIKAGTTTANASIQYGVDATNSHGTVTVEAGNFVGSVNVNKDDLTLKGANVGVAGNGARGTETTISSDSVVATVEVSADNVTINGFTVYNSAGNSILIDSTEGTRILNNVVHNDGSATAVMGYIDGSDTTVISNNLIENVAAGIELNNIGGGHSGNAVITNNELNVNNLTGTGIRAFNLETADVSSNTISGNLSEAIRVQNLDEADVKSNNINGSSQFGIISSGVDYAEIDGNSINGSTGVAITLDNSRSSTINDNYIGEGSNAGIIAETVDNLTIAGNTIEGVSYTGISVNDIDYADIEGNHIVGGTDYSGPAFGVSRAPIDDDSFEGYYSSTGIAVSNTDTVNIKRNNISEANTGISVYDAGEVDITRNMIRNISDTGIAVNYANDIDIKHNRISEANTGISVYGVGAGEVDIKRNRISDTNTGISVGGASYVSIIENDLEDFSDTGISLNGIFSINVEDNYLASEDAYTAISVNGAFGASINDNKINGSVYTGINVNGAVFTNIEKNEIGRSSTGISVEGGYQTYIADNTIEGASYTGISVNDIDYADIEGNHIVGGTDYSGPAFGVSRVSIDDDSFEGYYSSTGIAVSNTDTVNIKRNSISEANTGISVYGAGEVDIKRNMIRNISDTGIAVSGARDVDIKRNRISEANTGISVYGAGEVDIKRNMIRNISDTGIAVGYAGDVDIKRNMIRGVSDTGIAVSYAGDVDVESNHITGSSRDERPSYSVKKVRFDEDYSDEGDYYDESSSFTGIAINGVGNAEVERNYIGGSSTGISVDVGYQTYIANNTIEGGSDTGIAVSNFSYADIEGNYIVGGSRDSGPIDRMVRVSEEDYPDEGDYSDEGSSFTGIAISNVGDVEIDYNYINEARIGIALKGAGEAYISNNYIEGVSDAGIVANYIDYANIEGNYIAGSSRDASPSYSRVLDEADSSDESSSFIGIAVSEFGTANISGNTIGKGATNGIYLDNGGSATVSYNEIVGASENGIVIEGIEDAQIESNKVTGSGENGLYVKGANNGRVVVSNNMFEDNKVGAKFESGLIDFTGRGNYFDGNVTAIEFDKASADTTLKLVDNTFGAQEIMNSETYIILRNGALFETATDPLTGVSYVVPMNAYNVSFDGLSPANTNTPYAESELAKMLESMIIDYDDYNTLGDIFLGSILDDAKYEDRLAALLRSAGQSHNKFSISLRGMPYTNSAQAMNALRPAAGGNSPRDFNNMAPAAGGNSPRDFNNMEPAAGDSHCWSDLGSGATVSVDYEDNNRTNLLQQTSSCAVGS